MATASEIKSLQCSNIATVLRQDALCDVTFVIGSSETRFQANRVFLAVISDVLKVMLYGAMKEGQSNSVIRIPDIDVTGFEAVLAFAHCRTPQITIENVVSINHICRNYQITSLSPICDRFFESFISKETVCSLLNDSVRYKVDEYVDKCKDAVQNKLCRDAREIVTTDGFKSMELEAMKIFLQFDELNITEENLWDAVLEWKDYRDTADDVDEILDLLEEPASKRRKLNDGLTNKMNRDVENLKAVCPFFRFGLMEGTYFVDKVQPQKCLEKDEVIEISNYMLCSDKANRSCGKFSVQKREPKDRNAESISPLSPTYSPLSPIYSSTSSAYPVLSS